MKEELQQQIWWDDSSECYLVYCNPETINLIARLKVSEVSVLSFLRHTLANPEHIITWMELLNGFRNLTSGV
jgi:hypothetical protein